MICKDKVNASSIISLSQFYKVLLISYPNKQVRKEFESFKSLGIIPMGTTIGGKIEVHGGGNGEKGNKKVVIIGLGAVSRFPMSILIKFLKELNWDTNNNSPI
jgi:hypothetical protein